jgi:hypothetical protein
LYTYVCRRVGGSCHPARLLLVTFVAIGTALPQAAAVHAAAAAPPNTLFIPMVVGSTGAPPTAEPADPGTTTQVTAPIWRADMETGNLLQWRIGMNATASPEEDSGTCKRPSKGVSSEQAHSGRYSIKMVIDSARTSGCRQFRKPEPLSGQPLYYSAWYYFPKKVYVGGWWNILQFKSRIDADDTTDRGVFWKLEVRNNPAGAMMLTLVWKGPVAGPTAADGIALRQYYQSIATLPVKKWVHIEVYLKQSETFDGQITVWQDGVQIFDMANVRTKFPGGVQTWSVNNYGLKLWPNPTPLYIDDVVIGPTRAGQ